MSKDIATCYLYRELSYRRPLKTAALEVCSVGSKVCAAARLPPEQERAQNWSCVGRALHEYPKLIGMHWYC